MELEEVVKELHKLIDASTFKSNARLEGPYKYSAKEQWPETMPHTRNGIYFYTDTHGRILYIGKGSYKNNDGIGHRVCSHLGATNKDQGSNEIFPFHQWIEDSEVDIEINEAIRCGNFFIWTLPVQPDHIIPMAEVYLQTTYYHHHKRLPPLNKQIG